MNHRHEIFGDGYADPRFPILVKILDASDVVSVQVHPPVHQTGEFVDEPKTELWYFVAAEEGAGIYAGLKNGTKKKDFESALANGRVADLLHWIPTRQDVSFLSRADASTRLVQATYSSRFSRIAIRPTASLIGTGSDWTANRGPFTSSSR